MSTLSVAVLFASLVAKGVLDARRGALIAAVVLVAVQLLLREHPIPVVATAPLCFVALWGAFLLISRSTLAQLPLAVLSVLVAVALAELSRGWIVDEFQLHDAVTQRLIDDAQLRLAAPDGGTQSPGP